MGGARWWRCRLLVGRLFGRGRWLELCEVVAAVVMVIVVVGLG